LIFAGFLIGLGGWGCLADLPGVDQSASHDQFIDFLPQLARLRTATDSMQSLQNTWWQPRHERA
jgi:hypothetical protein